MLEVHDAAVGPSGKVWVEWASAGTRRDGITIELAGVAIFSLREDRISAARFHLEPVERESGDVNAAVHALVGAGTEGVRP